MNRRGFLKRAGLVVVAPTAILSVLKEEVPKWYLPYHEPVNWQIPCKQDTIVLPADKPKELKLGWIIYEKPGIVVINDYAIAKGVT